MKIKKIASLIGLLAMLVAFSGFTGCGGATLENGGAYAPGSTNADGTFVPTSAPDKALYVADASYKLAYDAVDAVFLTERNNRAAFEAISPSIKSGLDSIRPTAQDIDHRWALARAAYKASPTPANLITVQNILAEIQKLVPVVQSQLTITQ
jgi:hypothetical protein